MERKRGSRLFLRGAAGLDQCGPGRRVRTPLRSEFAAGLRRVAHAQRIGLCPDGGIAQGGGGGALQPVQDAGRRAGGCKEPNQLSTPNGTPDSVKVGTSGSAGERSEPLTASALTLPARISGKVPARSDMATGSVPPITSVSIGLTPL